MVKKPKVTQSADDSRRPPMSMRAPRLPGALRLGKPGALLICRILEEGGRRGLTKEELGQESLGIQRSYFSGLCAGDRDVPSLGEEAIAKAACFLGVARVTAKLMAGQLTDADFYAGPGSYRDALQPALRVILDDPEWVPPLSILSADTELQSFIVHLYERATQRKLIPGKLTQQDVIEQHRILVHEQESSAETLEYAATDSDRVLLACRKLGITLQSPRLRNGTIVHALGLATLGPVWSTDYKRKHFDIAAAVQTFAAELKMLDSINPQTDLFHTGVVAAALLALSLDPATLEFFSRLSEERKKGKMSGIPAPIRKLIKRVDKVKKRQAEMVGLVDAQNLCYMTLQAVEVWKKPEQGYIDSPASGTSVEALLTRTVERVRARKAAHLSSTR